MPCLLEEEALAGAGDEGNMIGFRRWRGAGAAHCIGRPRHQRLSTIDQKGRDGNRDCEQWRPRDLSIGATC